MTRRLRLVAALLLVTTAACAACSSSAEDDGPRTDPSPSISPPPSTPSASSAPFSLVEGPLGRCGPQPDEVARTSWRYQVLRDRAVGAVPSALAGRGRTVAVLLHQTNGGGLCGWLPYARQLAEAGVAALAIDLCRYGESRCRGVADDRWFGPDQVEAVRVAVEHARRDLGARRVVVVGASMGGSVALMSGATVGGIDAVVDLSGPVDWSGTEVVRGGRALRVPALVAMAETEGSEEVDGSRAIVDRAPAGSRFVLPEDGHGYDLLHDLRGEPLPFGQEVLAWIERGPTG
jgi:dienelactone hydrolase